MSFADALNCARNFRFQDVPNGRYSSLDNFYTEIVAPQEIDVDVLKGWTELLYKYVEDENAIVFVRKLERQERRGFRTMFNGGFSYVFSDNTLATLIYAMARTKIVPVYKEFRDYALRRLAMPLSMRPNGAERSELSAFPWYGHPKQNGWKLAHVNDINNSNEYNIDYEQFQRSYFIPGNLRDWSIDTIEGPIRRFGALPLCERRVFIAHFLRFCNPMNYFLVPGNYAHDLSINGIRFGRGIGEYNLMRRFIDQRRREALGKLYDLYLEKILSSGIVMPQGGDLIICTYPRKSKPTACLKAIRGARPANAQNKNEAHINKAVNRATRWAANPDCKPYRIIRAFLICCDNNQVAVIDNLRLLCSDAVIHPELFVASFDACFASMKTNAGNSYGLVFEQEGVHVRLHRDVQGFADLFSP